MCVCVSECLSDYVKTVILTILITIRDIDFIFGIYTQLMKFLFKNEIKIDELD